MARAFRALALFLTAWALATWAFLSTATGPALLRLRRPPQNESSSAARARRLPDAAGAPPWPPPAPAGPNRSAAPPPAPLPVYAYVTIVGTARYLDGGLALGHSLRRHSPCLARCTARFCCALAVLVPRGAPNSTVARLSHVFQAVLPVDDLSALAPSSYWKFSLNKVTSPGSNGGSWVVLVVFLVVLFFSENPHFLPHTRPTSPPSKTKAHATYAKTKRLRHMFPHATYAKQNVRSFRHSTYAQVHLPGLVQYARVAFFDADSLALRSPDAVFDTPLSDPSWVGAFASGAAFTTETFVLVWPNATQAAALRARLVAGLRDGGPYTGRHARDTPAYRDHFGRRFVRVARRFSDTEQDGRLLEHMVVFHYYGGFKPWMDAFNPFRYYLTLYLQVPMPCRKQMFCIRVPLPPPVPVQGGRGRSKGGEKPMGTTADGGNRSKGRAANGDRTVGAARCRRDHHTKGVMPNPPPPRAQRAGGGGGGHSSPPRELRGGSGKGALVTGQSQGEFPP